MASQNERLPHFLVVGAAKSATSSLHFYLDQHPQVLMASEKESWFFSFYENPPNYDSPGVLSDAITDLQTYLDLFKDARSDQKLGDASPSYLYTYEDTIKNIHKLYSSQELSQLKIIISLREPVSRAYSQYYTFKRKVKEPLNFAQATQQSVIQQRLDQNWNIFYDYLGFGMYSKQVEAFQKAFGKDRVLVVLFDDIHTDSPKVYQKIFSFLGVDPEFCVDDKLKHNNVSGEPRLKWIVAALFTKNKAKRLIAALIPKKIRMILLYIIVKPLLKRESIDVESYQRLRGYFSQDIMKLEQLIDRDLSAWRDSK